MPVEWSSRLLEAAAYDRSQALLQLSFRNGISYRYWDIPGEVYD
jgi:KTSC domain